MRTIPDRREGAVPGGPAAVLAGSAALQREMSAHPWGRALAGGTIPDAALAAWAGQRRLFCLYERAALHALRSLAADRGLDALLARLVDDTEREPRELAALLKTAPRAASPSCSPPGTAPTSRPAAARAWTWGSRRSSPSSGSTWTPGPPSGRTPPRGRGTVHGRRTGRATPSAPSSGASPGTWTR